MKAFIFCIKACCIQQRTTKYILDFHLLDILDSRVPKSPVHCMWHVFYLGIILRKKKPKKTKLVFLLFMALLAKKSPISTFYNLPRPRKQQNIIDYSCQRKKKLSQVATCTVPVSLVTAQLLLCKCLDNMLTWLFLLLQYYKTLTSFFQRKLGVKRECL